MKIDHLRKRLHELESRSSSRDVLLHFSDKSTRALRVKDPLGCLLASWDRVHAFIVGGAIPSSPHDATIDLLGKAEQVEAKDTFFQLIHSAAIQANEKETPQ